MSALLCAGAITDQSDTGADARAAVDVFLRGYRATVRDQVT